MKVLLAVLAAFLVVSPANGQSSIEIERDGGTSIKGLFEFLEKDADGVPTGLFVYTQIPLGNEEVEVSEGATPLQFYGGFWAKPIPWLKFSFGIGGEKPGKIRFGTDVLLYGRPGDLVSSYTTYEEGGGTGKFYNHETTFAFGPLNPGWFSQRFVGTGPFVEVPLPHNFYIAGGVGFGYGTANPFFALRKLFD